MRSMTGYGRGAAERGGRRATVEIRSVNHRFLDLKLRGAALEGALEDQVGARIREAVERGAVTATVHLERSGPAAIRFDADAARAVHAQLAALATALGTAQPDLALVIAQPGVVQVAASDDDGATGQAVLAAAAEALTQLAAMRDAEGARLAADVLARVTAIAGFLDTIGTRAQAAPAEARRRLDERLRRLLGDEKSGEVRELDPQRLAQEVAILADKLDVTEELVRAQSHVAQMRTLVTGKGAAVGRRLDFLVQELGREFNTIGAKSAAVEIVDLVVRGKAELEKIREQVQNVE
ncbi:MAG: YicC family protein [Deltaproteobacteria bacterium]|nr:YicC family protein [Deltaproteobacteria bacterium]